MSAARFVDKAAAPLRGRVRVPGDKSIAHRAVIFNAAGVGEAVVRGLPSGQDVASTMSAMRALGAGVERIAPGSVRIRGKAMRFAKSPGTID